MQFSIPSWVKELVSQVNRTGGEGMPTIVKYFDLFNHAGVLGARGEGFLLELTEIVEREEAELSRRQSHSDHLKSLKYPSLTGKDWKAQLHTWMQTIFDALHEMEGSPKTELPEPPDFNRAQRRLMAKFKLGLFFVPAWKEKDYPKSFVKPDWKRYLSGADVTPLPLLGRWIAFEVIQKPNYQDGVYPDDRLMVTIGLKTRFSHPHSEKGEGDDLVADILPKVSGVFKPLGGNSRIQSVKAFNFMGNLFNWVTQHTADSFPDLGSTNAVEWCENRCGSQGALIVGHTGDGGLAYVNDYWSGNRVQQRGGAERSHR